MSIMVQGSFMMHRNGAEHHSINASSDINHHPNQWKQKESKTPSE
jgi:hypothetical protein